MTTLLSESLFQVMLGSGKPSAVQLSVTVPVSFTVMLPEMPVMLGGSVKGFKEQNECDHEYVIISVCIDYHNWSGITGLNLLLMKSIADRLHNSVMFIEFAMTMTPV